MLFLDEIGELGLDEQAMILRAIEEKRFLPVGADKEAASDFQLIAGTNRDLVDARRARAASARTCWRGSTCGPSRCPASRSGARTSSPTSISSSSATPSDDGDERHLQQGGARSAISPSRPRPRPTGAPISAISARPSPAWRRSRRAGRINEATVEEEIARLRGLGWAGAGAIPSEALLRELLGAERLAAIDLFDRVQLREVIARLPRAPRSAPPAAAVRRLARAKTCGNDADRLRKYLARFDLDWHQINQSRAAFRCRGWSENDFT